MKVILGKAAASSKNKDYPKGEIHAILMFVKTGNNEKAQKIAQFNMQKRAWNKIKMSRIGAINLDTFNPEDDKIKAAFDSANESGFGLLVYPEIENDMMM